MKKHVRFLLVAAMLLGTTVGAAVREEWTFQKDLSGTLLANSINSGIDGDAFASGGGGILEADGLGALRSTPSNTNFWGDGVTLDANLTVSTNVLYLRYDLAYDATSELNTSGTSIGIQFVDGTGTNVAGLVFACDPTGTATAPAGKTLARVNGDDLGFSGTLSAIAKVDLSGPTNTLTVWYDATGANSFAEASPAAGAAISLSSFSDLRIQATGSATGDTNDFVSVENIRVADNWADISGNIEASVQSQYLNEWLFDRDIAGRTLAQAINSGTDGAVFGTDSTPVTQTDGFRGLICSNDVPGVGSLWTDGAVLRADVTNQSSGVRFLRYDLAYDMTSANNNSGTLLGLAFADTTSTNLAGVLLTCDVGNGITPPDGIRGMALSTDLELSGTLAVIAKVDLDNREMQVWYNLSGDNTFDPLPNATATNLNLTTIEELEFRATGDFIASASNSCVVIDNIRTAATWGEISTAPENLMASPELTVSISDSLGGAMSVGQTNVISVTITNAGGPATDVTSSLFHNGGAGLSLISSNNIAEPLGTGSSIVQTYSVVANVDGPYILTAQAIAETTNSAPATFDLRVGSEISFRSYTVTNDVGGSVLGEVESGETFDLIITSANDGGATVTGITNSLTAVNSSYFPTISVTNSSATYDSLAKNATTSTTYRVKCDSTTTNGLQSFTVINRTAGAAWTNQFQLNVIKGVIPSLSTNALTITVVPGDKASATLTLSNIGNVAGTYTLADIGNWAGLYYKDSTQTELMVRFNPIRDALDTNTTFTSWGTSGTASMPIGFQFPFMGTTYANFFVSRYGAVSFSAVVGANSTATLPSGTAALAAPFWGNTSIDTNSIRYTKADTNKLVVAWGNGTGAEFQTWLYRDGRIRYLYDQTTWTGGALGVQRSGTIYQNVAYQPGSGSESLLLTPIAWVTHTPGSNSVAARGSQIITYTADATGKSIGTTVLTNTVSMGGTTLQVTVTVIVQAATNSLTVTPSPVTFSGQAGSLSHTTMTVSNAGNTTLNYAISDLGAQANGYAWTNTPSKYAWDVPLDSDYFGIYTPGVSDPNDGVSDLIPIGFEFSYYGVVYTNLSIGVNGAVQLGETRLMTVTYVEDIDARVNIANYVERKTSLSTVTPISRIHAAESYPLNIDVPNHLIAPYWEDLLINDDTEITYHGNGNKLVITWDRISSAGGMEQSFQAILYKNGQIKFQYQNITGTNVWPNTDVGLRDTSSRTKPAMLARVGTAEELGTVTYKTNSTPIYGPIPPNRDVAPIIGTNITVVTNYASVVKEEAILFYPSNRIVIAASPVFGTLAPKTSTPITIYGDALSLPVGGSNYSVTNSTTLAVSSAAPTVNVPVTFIATNSAAASYADAVVRAAMFGTDESPVVSSQQNADGSRTLSWPVAQEDPFGRERKYTIEYTTSLSDEWKFLDTVDNPTSYTDRKHNLEPVIFYRVKVSVQYTE